MLDEQAAVPDYAAPTPRSERPRSLLTPIVIVSAIFADACFALMYGMRTAEVIDRTTPGYRDFADNDAHMALVALTVALGLLLVAAIAKYVSWNKRRIGVASWLVLLFLGGGAWTAITARLVASHRTQVFCSSHAWLAPPGGELGCALHAEMYARAVFQAGGVVAFHVLLVVAAVVVGVLRLRAARSRKQQTLAAAGLDDG